MQHRSYQRISLRRIVFSTLVALFILGGAVFFWISYPAGFHRQEIFLTPGTLPVQISETLQSAHIVRSAFILHVVLKLRGTGGALVPGKYLFDKKQSVFTVASRITRGKFGTEQMKVTIPEGSTNEQIAGLIAAKFPDFDSQVFLTQAVGKQGYLFPETYYLLSTSTEDVIEKLTDSFDYHARILQAEAISEGKDWRQVVTMASILEEEADTPEDFRLVSGVLWKRLSIGMALQVDAATDTYKKPGLPERPLSNPGLATLDAALHPKTSNHLYYLTGKDGMMHYATTFDEHKKNIATYLR